MSFNIPISSLPNQELSFTLDDASWVVVLKSTKTSLLATIIKEGKTLVENARAVAGEFIIQYPYLGAGSNFFIQTSNGEIPYYTEFNNTQFLIFMTADEVQGVR